MQHISNLELEQADSTVWIFGAGASRSEPYDIPIQTQLLQRFATMTRPGTAKFQAKLQELRERVRRYCQKVQPGVAYDDQNLTLEEVFSAYELVLREPRSSQEERLNAENALRDLGDALRHATMVFGRGDARHWKPHDRNGTPSPYAELLEKLFPKDGGAQSLKRHKLVTFNYDINLDRCLLNLRGAMNVDLDYGIPLANSRSEGAPGFSPPNPDRSVLLLRMHGALNWLRCMACLSCFTTVDHHAHAQEASECWSCRRNRLEYILVYPSYLRTYTDPLIQLTWGRCHEELVRAERWVFIGYSLPTADVHFRELLRDCLRIRDTRGMKTSVVLVGKGPENEQAFVDQLATYKRLFENSPAELLVWEPTAHGFSDFVKYALAA